MENLFYGTGYQGVVEMKKKMITVYVGKPYKVPSDPNNSTIQIKNKEVLYDLTSDIDELISTLQKLKSKYSAEYTDLYFEHVADCGCYNDCSCVGNWYLKGTREESDIEKKHREDIEEKHKKYKEDQEKKLYETLKKKFGD